MTDLVSSGLRRLLVLDPHLGALKDGVQVDLLLTLLLLVLVQAIMNLQGTDLQNKKTASNIFLCEKCYFDQWEGKTKLYSLPFGRKNSLARKHKYS